jgi:hypothetical protein
MTIENEQRIPLESDGTRIIAARIETGTLGFELDQIWCSSPSRSHRTAPYPVPKTVRIGTQSTDEAAARFTPPPYAVIVEGNGGRCLVTLEADPGWHRWNFAAFSATAKGLTVSVDLEGHTPPQEAVAHIQLRVVGGDTGNNRYALLARGLRAGYPDAYASPVQPTPHWWSRPIYCGWGDQVAMSLHLEGPGREPRALAYNTEGLYRRWIARLEEAKVPIGTIIIDAGWSPGGIWQPYPNQWPDLRGFIAEQHDAGRHVLLWIPTWLYEGLPPVICVRADDQPLVADATNPNYLKYVGDQVRRLLSDGKQGYNADGFKIDQLAYVPTEIRPRGGEQFGRSFRLPEDHAPLRQYGSDWGFESLYRLQKTIYEAAKAVKPDALINSSTIHPYFHDTFDMARLHDTGTVDTDVFAAMKARADLVRASVPNVRIDTDDWVHHDYAKWLDYTRRSHQLGVPCLFYAERFVLAFDRSPATRPIAMDDLRSLASVWDQI